ncbi:MAG: sensor histidine kinase, partial [Nitriliruptoraceae bacterium]
VQPAHQESLDRERDDPDRALADLGRTLEVTADPSAALTQAAERIAGALAVPWVAIEVVRASEHAEPGARNGSSHLATSGRRPGWADDHAIVSVELSHAGTRYGTLSVSRRSPGEPLSSRDRDLLARLAYPIAATAAAFRLNDDLRRSRERLVVAREEERRRLRHDLHDELGPLLAAIALQVDAARLRSRRTSGGDDPLLTDLRDTAQDAIATVRRTVEDLRPPALDELGLVGALQATAATFTATDGPNLTVDTPDLPPLPAAVEVAAYRIAVEAVTNAIRHADAREIVIRLAVADDTLVVVVQDDGRGVPVDAATGVGTTSMRERAEELAGSCSIGVRRGGGTEVHARLPIGAT